MTSTRTRVLVRGVPRRGCCAMCRTACCLCSVSCHVSRHVSPELPTTVDLLASKLPLKGLHEGEVKIMPCRVDRLKACQVRNILRTGNNARCCLACQSRFIRVLCPHAES